MTPDISIITVTTNDRGLVLDMLQSVRDTKGDLQVEQIVVDNGSSNGIVQQMRDQFPKVTIHENGANLGFGAANNAGLQYATAPYILLLNPDMQLHEGTLQTMLEWMEQHTDVGLASCKLVDQHGAINTDALPRRFPGVLDQLAIVLKLSKVFPGLLSRYLYKGFDADTEQDVDSVRGSFMIIRREIVDTLGWVFDPRYFIWFEDVDTCREVLRLGYRVVYTPVATCTDYVGQTFKHQPQLQKQIWFTTSMVTYFRKWEPVWKWLPIVIARPIGISLVLVYDKLILPFKKT